MARVKSILLFFCISVLLFLCILLTLSQLHFAKSKPLTFSLKLIHRDSPQSPLHSGNISQGKRIERLIKYSKARAIYLETSLSPNRKNMPDNILFGMLRDSYLYIAVLGIGSPPQHMYLLTDTGSGLVWTQCIPYKNCYSQNVPLYNSTASSTYNKLPCDHPLCGGANPIFQCVDQECIYKRGYAGGSSTRGIASLETIYSTDENFATKALSNVIFGCSNDQRNFPFPPTTKITGILGLGLSRDSFVAQLGHLVGKSFQYCLVPFFEHPSASTLLRFGNGFHIPSGIVQTTPFVVKPRLTHYQLDLLDISVGSQKMGFPQGTFQINGDGSGGCIIDSGAAVSHFDNKAYDPIMRLFEDTFRPYNLERYPFSPQGFELCYKFRADFLHYPTMTFHFKGADFVVDPKCVHIINNVEGYFCVALLPISGMTVLGAWQQTNTRFTYDLNKGVLHFFPEDCTKKVIL